MSRHLYGVLIRLPKRIEQRWKAPRAPWRCHAAWGDPFWASEPLVYVDETGHHDDGKLHWTWYFVTACLRSTIPGQQSP